MLYLDIETDGLDPTVIHCVGYAIDNEPAVVTTSSEEFIQVLVDVSTIVAHNGIAFDLVWLNRLWGIDFKRYNIIDTLVLSRLLEPDRKGGHSLDAWGQRLRYPKQGFNDWQQYSETMAEYCRNDVELLRCLYKALRGPVSDFGNSVEAEHKVAAIIAEQCSNGFLLDKANAESLWVAKAQRMNQIETDLQKQFLPIVTERFSTKTGKRLADNVEVFNVGSRQQVAKRLETIGAIFTEKTETGQAVINEKTLAALSMPEADLVLEYLTLQKHTGLLSSWVDAAGPDNRVRGYVNTVGAVTGRMTHSRPNLAQIPSDANFRRLWTVEEGNVLVGIDASGLELRMLAHYMDDAAYTEQLLSGDIHTYNQALAGLETRNQAKTFIYAFLYGAGDGKIGEIVNGSSVQGRKLRDTFLDGLPALSRLIKKVQRQSSQGYVTGLDGRRINVRSEHAALNTLLQGAGAIVMKWWLIELDQRLKAVRIPYKFVANVHDEVQIETPELYGTKVAKIGLNCFKYVTKQLNLNCPLAGDAKVGLSWADTH